MIPRSVVIGRRLAVAGLALSALLVAALALYLVVWWATGSPPFTLTQTPGATA